MCLVAGFSFFFFYNINNALLKNTQKKRKKKQINYPRHQPLPTKKIILVLYKSKTAEEMKQNTNLSESRYSDATIGQKINVIQK